MGLTNENVGPKILAKIKIYVLTRAELLFKVCYEIPCTLIWDVINERFLKSCKKGQIYLEHLNNRFSLSCFFRALVYSLTILKANTHPFILMVEATLKQVAIKEITVNFNIFISDFGLLLSNKTCIKYVNIDKSVCW